MAARATNKLTTRGVRALKADGWYGDGAGLWLRISREGASRQWIYRFRLRGVSSEMGLGAVADVELGEAREAAQAARKLVKAGKNPIHLRREERAAAEQPAGVPTFGEVADGLIADLESGWKNVKHRAQWKATLDQHAAALKPMPVTEVGTEEVLAVLKPLWAEKPETASRLRGRIERVLDAAKARGHRTGENPARLRGHLALLLPKQSRLVRGHHKAMPWTELPAFMAELRTKELGAADGAGETLGGDALGRGEAGLPRQPRSGPTCSRLRGSGTTAPRRPSSP